MLSELQIDSLLQRARQGDSLAVEQLFAQFRDRLCRMVEFRLDDRLRARMDASDVVQEAQLEVFTRLGDFFAKESMPFFVWLRLEVGKHLMILHRRHLGTAMRDPRREVSIHGGTMPASNSDLLAVQLLDRHSSPSHALSRAERIRSIREAVDGLEPIDQEIITLRHFEMLNHHETAQVLGISEAAAAKRYIRALDRLQTALADLPGGLEGL